MYSDQSTKNLSNPLAEELRWVIQIRRMLDEELGEEEEEEEEGGIPPVSIFRVPTAWLAGKSECYVPQLVGIGPYHRWRPEFHGMEWYKLSAARRIRGQLRRGLEFHHVVDQLARLEHRLRTSYHGYLDYNGETLAWAMAIDASFLLGFLQNLVPSKGEASSSPRARGKMSHLVDSTGRKCAHNMILRDLIMLENQIPLRLLRVLLEAQHPQAADDLLSEMAAELVKSLCPFNMMGDPPLVDVAGGSHLLDLLYNVIVPKPDRCRIHETRDEVDKAASDGFLRKLSSCLGHAVASRPVKLLMRVVPWGIITNLPLFLALKHSVEHLSSSPKGNAPEDNNGRPLLAEEIAIPSATELVAAGMQFSPTNGGPTGVAFDGGTATLYLPAVSLDVNTETSLRNLVAYEVSSPAAGAPVLARYVELMDGIIDGEDDVRVLRESGVVRNRMRSDGEAAELWNGMSRWVQLTRVPPLDRAIEEVNSHYHSRWRVKAGKLLKGRGGSETCSCLAFLASVLLLFLVGLHAFCLFSRCRRPNPAVQR